MARNKNFIQKILLFIDRHKLTIVDIGIALTIIAYLISFWVPEISKWLIDINLLDLLTVVFFMYILRLLITIDERLRREYFNIFPNQASSNEDVEEFIKHYNPKNVDILAYSAFSISPVILKLLKVKHCNIKILLADPSLFPESEFDFHKARQKTSLDSIKLEIESIMKSEGKLNSDINIKSYDVTPCIRGIKLDSALLSVGWYMQSKINDERSNETLRGHSNPSLHLKKIENTLLFEMFDNYFEQCWETAKTIEF